MAIDWDSWKFLLGEWAGANEGDPGQGYGTFSFAFDLDQNILVRRNHTVFPASDKREAFTHDDLLFVYYELDGTTRAIYFDNEEHVIHYKAGLSADQKAVIFVSDPLPGVPQFRLTYQMKGDETLMTRFEMTPPGQAGAFFVYLEGDSKRVSSK